MFPLNVESQTWENEYGKLTVYPDISRELLTQKQFYNITWYYPDNDLDIAFCFNESLSYGGVYYWNGTAYKNIAINHVVYNSKHYYVLSDIHFVQNEIKCGYWEYNTPINSSGKWDMFIKLHDDTWQYAFANDRMIHLDPWWNSSYGHMKQITIDHDYIDTNLINFPVLVASSDTTMLEKMDDGDSLRFTNLANDTEYNFEIEKFDDTDEMIVWVNVTYISASVDTVFNMYYNNSAATDGQNIVDVWNSDYMAVWHMSSLLDSTSNDIDLTNAGADYVSNGLIGGCYDYVVANTDWLIHATFLDVIPATDEMTWEAYIEPDSYGIGLYPTFISKYNTDGQDRVMFRFEDYPLSSTDDYLALFGEGSNGGVKLCTETTHLSVDIPYYCVGMYKKDTALKVIRDGTIITTGDVIDEIKDGTYQDFFIGTHRTTSGFFDGEIDEVRISSIVRNDSWIKATFHSENQTAGFLTIGNEYNKPTFSTFTLSNPIPVNNSEISCLNLSQLCVDIVFSCGAGDYVNITLIHDGNTTYDNDTTSIVNGTYCLSLSGVNLTEGQYYIWWVNVSSSCADETVTTNSWYNFTCEAGCDCYDEIAVLNYKLDQIQQTLDDGVGGGGIGGSGNVIGMIGLFGLFGFIGYLSGKEKRGSL